MRPAFSFLLLAILLAVPATAQVQSQPTPPPIVTAENDSWYVNREPILFAGELYYFAGAAVFFNGDSMTRTGYHEGVPLYSDTTLEAYSVLYVPIGGGRMQPYERRRNGDLAGTTGSRAPSFPVSIVERPENPAPTPTETIGEEVPSPVDTYGEIPALTRRKQTLGSIPRPTSNDGVWVWYLGEKWISAGMAVPVDPAEFYVVGTHAGFPVFERRGLPERVIYVSTGAGLVAPYRLKQHRRFRRS